MTRVRLLLLPLLLLGCHRTSVTAPENLEFVLGHWEWQSACCSIAGAGKTPATEGYSYVLQFDPDGTVSAFRNGELLQKTHFTITTPDPTLLASQLYVITYDVPLELGPGIQPAKVHGAHKTENGTLSLNTEGCADCYNDWRFLPRLTQ